MGTGNYSHCDGKTVILALYDDLPFEDGDIDLLQILSAEAFSDLKSEVSSLLDRTTFRMTEGTWRSSGRDECVLAENRLYQIWCVEDSYGNTFLTYGISENLDPDMDGLARAWLDERAERFFDRLQETQELRVASSPWTSSPRCKRAA